MAGRSPSRGPNSRVLHRLDNRGVPSGTSPEPSAEPDLIRRVRAMLRETHPLPSLGFASSLLAITDPQQRLPYVADPADTHEGSTRYLVATTRAWIIELHNHLDILGE